MPMYNVTVTVTNNVIVNCDKYLLIVPYLCTLLSLLPTSLPPSPLSFSGWSCIYIWFQQLRSAWSQQYTEYQCTH